MNSEISAYVMSIVGCSIILVLIDLVLPDGQMNKYIKGIGAFFLVAIMVSPIISFDPNKSLEWILSNEFEAELDQDFLENVHSSTAEQCENSMIVVLSDAGFLDVIIDVEHVQGSNYFEIEKVMVDITNMTMDNNGIHYNKYSEITSLIINNLNVEKEDVIISG